MLKKNIPKKEAELVKKLVDKLEERIKKIESFLELDKDGCAVCKYNNRKGTCLYWGADIRDCEPTCENFVRVEPEWR